ncbi:MAG: TRAP transporter substrate-binding protein DctP, partial [Nitrosopumilus sp.]
VHFFTQTPMTRPEELKAMELFVWSNESSVYSLWVEMGFHPVPLAATDITMGLNTGMINAFDTTPIAALSNQWFPLANHMADMKWAPLVGATVIKVETWKKIPVEYRKVMLQIANLSNSSENTKLY